MSTTPIYQFKITLKDSKPAIWRRIQVEACTLDELHEHIQTSMGWDNSHLHRFEIDGQDYGIPEHLDHGYEDFQCINSTETNLNDFLPKDKKPFSFLYVYDFGDNWVHEIQFEGCLEGNDETIYPLCLEGEMNCPLEDVGGVWGHERFLEVQNDPKHEEHEFYVEWGGGYDPKDFQVDHATEMMREGLEEWEEDEDE